MPCKFLFYIGKMADISKDRLRKEIAAILKNADLTKTSAKKVRQQLEEKLEVDLADQKKVVDELVMEVLKDKKGGDKGKKKKDDSDEDGEQEDNDEENGGEDNEDEDEEEADSEEEEKKKKAPKRAAPKKAKDSESEEASEDDDEDEYSPKKKAKATAKKGAAKKKKKGSDSDSDEDWAKKKPKKSGGGGGAKKGKGGSGYTKACTLSPELAKLVGEEQMPRHEVVKKVWAIIKERNLYDPKNKQFAICDNDLFKVFGVKRFRTFGMMKHLKDHFIS